jgi:hypothetical protein
MPVFGMHQKTFFMLNQPHEKNMKDTGSKTLGFAARNMLISENGPTHCDAVWEYEPTGPTIEKMNMKFFWGTPSVWMCPISATRTTLKSRTWMKR